MNLNVNPNSKQLEEIKFWLIEEYEKFNQGFYCNWNVIESAFNRKQFFSFEIKRQIIGFISWTAYSNPYVVIDTMEIHPNFRKKGFGKILYQKAENYFRQQNYIAIQLFCSPKESEKFWKKMKFTKFPETGYSEPELSYYKPLIEINKPINKEANNKLELWDLEPYEIKEQKPKWTWEIKENQKPILQPYNANWNLRLTLNGKIEKENKVKYFSPKREIEIGPFLFIEKHYCRIDKS